MTRLPQMTVLGSLGLTLLMLSVITSPVLTTLADEAQAQPTEGRQETLDVDCSGYTFEDLFEYDFALFELEILDDWATGDMYANAWVNGSNSAIVRDNLDGLFEGLPGGDNDWISTDDRDAGRRSRSVRSAALTMITWRDRGVPGPRLPCRRPGPLR